MTIPETLRTREPRAAARSCVLILAVCAAVLTMFNLQGLDVGSVPARVASWGGVAVLVAAAVACARCVPEDLDRWGLLTTVGVGGVVLICALNLLTRDSSAAAQAFLALPVLWTSSHFRPGAAVLVTATVIGGDGVALVALLPLGEAVTDLVFFGAVLVVMAVMLVRAGTTQDRLVAALREQARVDALTGLVNRRVFDGALESVLSEPVPGGTALVLIDVDAFKSINDTWGHPVGDAVLVHLAGLLHGQVREGDAVLSRLGGDELAVLLPGCAAHVAERRAEELLDAVRATPLTLPDGTLLSLSISVGVAHAGPHEHALSGLYSAADAALYRAKRAGRGRVAVASA